MQDIENIFIMTVTIERNGGEYIPYGKEWSKELMKLKKDHLILLATESGFTANDFTRLTKKQIIFKYRSKLLVDKFNNNVAIGTSFNWRPAIGEPYQKVTTRCKAYISKNNGLPIVFVSEKPAYISIEPEFVMSFF